MGDRYKVKGLSRTGGANTFRFVSFTERINGMSADVFRKVDRSLGAGGFGTEYESHFHEALEKWLELNATKHYTNFAASVRPLVQTLPMLLLHKDRIVRDLLRYLHEADETSQEPFLVLLGVMARDLLQEFRPYFEEVVESVLTLLNPKDPVLAEQIFQCIGYCFKYLRKMLLKEVTPLLVSFYHRLLAHRNEFIRRFAAESFSFLIRNSSQEALAGVVATAFDMLRASADAARGTALPDKWQHLPEDMRYNLLADGIARLLFETCKGAKGHFHSKTSIVLGLLFEQLKRDVPVDNAADVTFSTVYSALDMMVEYTELASGEEAWLAILAHLRTALTDYSIAFDAAVATPVKKKRAGTKRRRSSVADSTETAVLAKEAGLCNVLQIVCKWTECQRGSRWVGSGKVEKDIKATLMLLLTETAGRSTRIAGKSLSWLAAVAEAAEYRNARFLLEDFLVTAVPLALAPSATQLHDVADVQLAFCVRMRRLRQHFAKHVLAPMLSLCTSLLPLGFEAAVRALLEVFRDDSWDRAVARTVVNVTRGCRVLEKHAGAVAAECVSRLSLKDPSMVWASASLLPNFDTADMETRKALEATSAGLKEQLAAGGDLSGPLALYGAVSEALTALYLTYAPTMLPVQVAELMELVQEHRTSLHVVQATTAALTALKEKTELQDEFEDTIESYDLADILPFFHENLNCSHKALRLATLLLTSFFHSAKAEADVVEEQVQGKKLDVLQYFVHANRMNLHSVNSSKEVQRLLDLDPFIRAGSLPAYLMSALPHLLVGLLHTQFRPMSTAVTKLLTTYAGVAFDTLWPVLWAKMELITEVMDRESAEGRTPTAVVQLDASGGYSNKKKRSGVMAHSMGTKKEETATTVDSTLLEKFLARGLLTQTLSSQYDAAAASGSLVFGQSPGCVDASIYNSLLWQALWTMPEHLERKTKLIVPVFMTMMQEQYAPTFWRGLPWEPVFAAYNASRGDDEKMTDADVSIEYEARVVREKLRDALTLFSKFTNPLGVYASEHLRLVFDYVLTYSDPGVQQLVLQCIGTWRHEALVPYMERLQRLVDEKTFREELALFSIDPDLSDVVMVEEKHRADLLPVLTRILYSKLQYRGKASIHSRRSAVLSYLCGFRPAELQLFVSLMLQPFAEVVAALKANVPKKGSLVLGRGLHELLDDVPINKQLGYLYLLRDITKQLGGHVESYMDQFLGLLLVILERMFIMLPNAKKGGHKGDGDSRIPAVKIIRLRNEAILRLGDVLDLLPDFDFSRWLSSEFFDLVDEVLLEMGKEMKASTRPLLELFLVMSAQRTQAHMLLGSDKLIPSVIRCFSASSVPAKIIMKLLSFVENMQKMEAETELLLLRPHVDLLLEHMQGIRITSLSSHHSRRQLAILSNVSEHATDGKQADAILTMLLRFLGPGHRIDSEGRVGILTIFRNFVGIIDDPLKHSRVVAMQFRLTRDKDVRDHLCKAYAALAGPVPAIEPIVDVLQGLNSFSGTLVSTYNFDDRLAGFKALNALLEKHTGKKALLVDAILPLVCNCLYFLNDEDIAIRESATDSLKKLVRYMGDSMPAAPEADKEDILQVVTHCILPVIKKSIRHAKKECRAEHLELLSVIVQSFPALYPDLVPLTAMENEEGEVTDLFSSLAQISNQAKTAAIVLFRQRVTSYVPGSQKEHRGDGVAAFRTGTLVDILVPILGYYVLNNSGKTNSDGNLVDEATRCIGAIASKLPWGRYLSVLTRYMGCMETHKVAQKRLIRLYCEIIDNFHFDIRTGLSLAAAVDDDDDTVMADGDEEEEEEELMDEDPSDEVSDIEEDEEMEEAEEEQDDEEAEAEEDDAEAVALAKEKEEEEKAAAARKAEEEEEAERAAEGGPSRVERAIVKSIIPQFHTYLKVDKSLVALCVQVALAIVKLIRLLPEARQGAQLRQLLSRLVGGLTTREQEKRDDTRATLQEVVVAIGPKYFGYVLKELRGQLTKGYQLQILGFTIHALLHHLRGSMVAGDLDHCADDLVTTLIEDIVGEAGEKKQVKAIQSSMKESRSVKSYDSFEILAQCLTFKTHVRCILYPIHGVLTATVSMSLVKQMEEILRRAVVGLTRNTSIEVEDLLLLIYHITSGNLQFYHGEMRLSAVRPEEDKGEKETRVARLHAKPQNAYLVPEAPRMAANKAKKELRGIEANLHVLAEFALALFHSSLKRNKFDLGEHHQLELLDPFVTLLLGCLSSKHTKTMVLALKNLGFLVRFRLPSVEEKGGNITTRVFKLLKKCSSKTGGLMEACFKTMVVVIRDCKVIKLTDGQLRFLIHLIDTELDHLERSALTFSMLKAIVSRQLVVAELYDLMNRVSQLMVTSHTPAVRDHCAHVFLNFLIFYPLGERRMQQHLRFILRNLSYHTETGRQSVLSLMNSMVERFPEQLINQQAEVFTMALVLRLVNDDSQECKTMVAHVLKALAGRVSPPVFQRMFDITIRWYTDSDKLAMQWAAAQLLGLYVEALGHKMLKPIAGILPALVQCVAVGMRLEEESKEQYDYDEEEDMDDDLDDGREMWRPMYFTLGMLEKLFRVHPPLMVDEKVADLWPLLEKAMMHTHIWVRVVTNRLWGMAFARSPAQKLEAEEKTLPHLLRTGAIFSLASNSCSQLYSKLLTTDAANQTVKNLVFLSRALHSHPQLAGPLRRNAKMDEAEEDDEMEELATDKKTHQSHVHWIFRRLSFMARRAGIKQPETSMAVFRFFAAMCMSLKPKQVVQFLVPVISPMYRAVEHQKDGPVRELAVEVMELVKQRVDTESFAAAYNTVRKSVTENRIRRKRRQALEAVLDPERHAAYKQRKNLKKRAARKKKIESYKPNRNSMKVKQADW